MWRIAPLSSSSNLLLGLLLAVFYYENENSTIGTLIVGSCHDIACSTNIWKISHSFDHLDSFIIGRLTKCEIVR